MHISKYACRSRVEDTFTFVFECADLVSMIDENIHLYGGIFQTSLVRY